MAVLANRGVLGTAVVAVVIAYAALSTVWTSHDPGWYAALPKPSWQPPDLVFGIIWPYNFFALLAVGLALVSRRPAGPVAVWLAVLVVNVVLALAWAYLFYVPHALTPAAVLLGGSAVAAWVLFVLAWQQLGWPALLVLPYAIWVSLATALAFAYARS